MCTSIVSIDPHSAVPVLLVGVRDEFLDRPWRAPGRHWPALPGLVGGQDLQAEGTWLAVHPGVPRVACVLNGHGPPAEEPRRRSRGELPLRLAADGELGDLDPVRYDPFHLLCAAPDATRLWSWDGEKLTERTLGPGLHLVVNSGLEAADDEGGPGAEELRARVAYLRPLLQRAHRPEPDPATSSGDVRAAWGEWFPHVAGGGLDTMDPRALVVRRTFGERHWGTSSVSLVALGRDGARYDFCPDPAAARPVWSAVLP
jgi:uncharacterized protein with NRDE domain